MECLKYRKLITYYVDGELSEVQENALIMHISKCPNCKNALKNESALKSYIKDSYVNSCDIDISRQVMTKIRSQHVNRNVAKNINKVNTKKFSLFGSVAILMIFFSAVALFHIFGTDSFVAKKEKDQLEHFVYEHMEETSTDREQSFALTSVNFEQ